MSKGKTYASSNSKDEVDNTSVHCVGQVLAVLKCERIYIFLNLLFVFSLTLFVGNSPISSSLQFTVLW